MKIDEFGKIISAANHCPAYTADHYRALERKKIETKYKAILKTLVIIYTSPCIIALNLGARALSKMGKQLSNVSPFRSKA